MIKQGVEDVQKYAQERHGTGFADNTGNDVTQDIAQTYNVEKISDQIIAENDAVYRKLAE